MTAHDNKALLDRIECKPDVMLGKPVIKGTRLTVNYIMQRVNSGESASELIKEYPGLTELDVQACLKFAEM